MSLLEDVFLQDEANEAQELERIIEGDEYEGRPRSDSDENSEKEDEAEEDKRRIDPNTTKTRRVIKNPRFILNPARLTGPRGIQVIPDHFKDFKFKGKGHEREDLDLVLKKLEHWAYRLYPKFQFEDCLKKIETLGKKRPVMVHLQKIRSDQFLTEETVTQKDSSDEEAPAQDEFDKLLQQQIELARSTPAPGSVKKVLNSPVKENRSYIMPKATSSPSISEEQRERMLRNRKLAEERRLARLKNQSNINTDDLQNHIQEIPTSNNISSNDKSGNVNDENVNKVENNTEIRIMRHNRSNVIESSDEDEAVTVNESIRVDVHNALQTDKNIDNHSDKIEESVTNYDNDQESNEEIELLQNHKNLDKPNDNIEQNSTSTKDDPVHDNNKESNEDNSNKDGDNLIDIEISNTETTYLNTQETNTVNRNTLEVENKTEDQVSAKNQDTDENEKVENVEDLMDVDFSDDF